jgi:hypothetical protein
MRSTHSSKTSSISMFLVFTGWTVASAQYAQTGSNPSSTAVIACVNYDLALQFKLHLIYTVINHSA